jgi:hypothetical protein
MRPAIAGPTGSIGEISWVNLRVKVQIEGAAPECQVAIRTKLADPESTKAGPKQVAGSGSVSLVVEDDTLEGNSVIVVLLDASGTVLAKRATVVGGDS